MDISISQFSDQQFSEKEEIVHLTGTIFLCEFVHISISCSRKKVLKVKQLPITSYALNNLNLAEIKSLKQN